MSQAEIPDTTVVFNKAVKDFNTILDLLRVKCVYIHRFTSMDRPYSPILKEVEWAILEIDKIKAEIVHFNDKKY